MILPYVIILSFQIFFQDSELQETITSSQTIMEMYAHYFDYIIVHMDPKRTYRELLDEINRLEVEPQWIPTYWLS